MSLSKKYTWADFLKANPEHKAKKTKRTSKEGAKAFEAAYKQHVKEYLKARMAKIDKESARCPKNKAYLVRLETSKERAKMLQKNV
ncbi:MAG: hypothetical protein COV46_08790 [Deltaproteobacteria bacterium CG11_big_fil_rev_8_21_14_0_20_49_13]|nr:MAG: hypothetical protein COV46_08790 [Deltaproteobacteria bacterium CG11_big_fil_rev_8_21_14_0_20_49_13]